MYRQLPPPGGACGESLDIQGAAFGQYFWPGMTRGAGFLGYTRTSRVRGAADPSGTIALTLQLL